jgi:predicted nuclease of predicted toxin-antitoxin system
MRLLLDQDVYAATAQFLSGLGHDVLRVAQIGLAQAKDEEILRVAQSLNRILLTRDRDYGNLVGDFPSYSAALWRQSVAASTSVTGLLCSV